MQLPENLQHFTQATLILVANRGEAKIYLAGGESVEELDSLSAPEEEYSDNEGTDSSPDSEMKDEERFRGFVKDLTGVLDELVAAHDIKAIHLVMPAEVVHALEAEMSGEVSTLVGKKVEKNLTNQSPLEIVEALLA